MRRFATGAAVLGGLAIIAGFVSMVGVVAGSGAPAEDLLVGAIELSGGLVLLIVFRRRRAPIVLLNLFRVVAWTLLIGGGYLAFGHIVGLLTVGHVVVVVLVAFAAGGEILWLVRRRVVRLTEVGGATPLLTGSPALLSPGLRSSLRTYQRNSVAIARRGSNPRSGCNWSAVLLRCAASGVGANQPPWPGCGLGVLGRDGIHARFGCRGVRAGRGAPHSKGLAGRQQPSILSWGSGHGCDRPRSPGTSVLARGRQSAATGHVACGRQSDRWHLRRMLWHRGCTEGLPTGVPAVVDPLDAHPRTVSPARHRDWPAGHRRYARAPGCDDHRSLPEAPYQPEWAT